MKKCVQLLQYSTGLAISIASICSADVTITAFDEFNSTALYGSWLSATIESNPTNYVITATGYGSNYKYIGSPRINGTGASFIQLDVTLSGPPAADGKLGPIIDLIDGDGTRYSYRWYGQNLGHRVLKMAVKSPSQVVEVGSTPGLDLSNIQHLHMQLDPGGFGNSGAYTIAWNDLSFTGFPAFKITAQSYNPTTGEFSLTWNSQPGRTYSIKSSVNFAGPFTPLITGVESMGITTTATVILPKETSGFIQLQQE